MVEFLVITRPSADPGQLLSNHYIITTELSKLIQPNELVELSDDDDNVIDTN